MDFNCANYVRFCAAFREAYQAPVRPTFLYDQFKALCAGERGAGIHDTALVAWEQIQAPAFEPDAVTMLNALHRGRADSETAHFRAVG